MKVSIVIPTYKRPGMLKRAIESCLNQSYSNIEIIIVDDNNPDTPGRKETEDFMKNYESIDKIKYLKREANGGGSLARNSGIEYATGDYIAFLDDDDVFYGNKIDNQLNFMIINNLDASFTASQVVDEPTEEIIKIKKYSNFNQYKNIFNFHLVEMIVSTQTFMYKKEVLKTIGMFENVPAGQEYYLMYKTLLNGFKVGYLDEVLTKIYIHKNERITTSRNKIKGEKFLYNLKKKHFNLLSFKEKRLVTYIYKYNLYNAYANKNKFLSLYYLISIVLFNPIVFLNRVILKKGGKK